ncbi:hypothetical protein VC83_08847 [Pseudogymnoascus destructans]|uniref:Gamma-glutamylcyclotransferase AIG2-like domain-containing protein n=2 Tax=Pseudogymnoascus destructans TaxID=655981 RepID=A0A176ZZF4_9PEZI|nr:uncharacterized protein VC83_08847 [Pseudogymnoascus destructans]OAF54622.2 hypothetical protein VC83_08847 [Pseudogymnoascus destructans]
MVPQILYRVCYGTENPLPELISHLRLSPALLRNYSCRKVRHADFPGIIAQKNHTVLGTLISGLSKADVSWLDQFEGDMYKRVFIEVQALEAEVFDAYGNIKAEEMEKVNAFKEGERNMVRAETYVWDLGKDRLESEEWLFADFRSEKMKNWVDGPENDGTVDHYDDSGTERGSQDGDGKGGAPETEKGFEIDGGHVEDEEQEKRRIASVVAGIAAKEAEDWESDALMSAV